MLPRSLSDSQSAAIYVGMATILLVGVWLIMLFTGASFDIRGLSKVARFTMFIFGPERPDRWIFVVLAILPILSAVIAIAYLRGIARTRRGAITSLICTFAVASTAFLAPTSVLALVSLLLLPALFFGFRCLHGA